MKILLIKAGAPNEASRSSHRQSALFMSAAPNGLASGATVPQQLDNTLTHFHCSLNVALVSPRREEKESRIPLSGFRTCLADGSFSKTSEPEDNAGTPFNGSSRFTRTQPICILMVFWRCPWASVGSALFRPVGFHPWKISIFNKQREAEAKKTSK